MTDRQTIIEILMATRGMSEGQTADAILSALTAPRVPEGWKPIETAPIDGTAVLVMRDIWPGTKTGRAEECNEHNTYVAAWWSEEGNEGEWVCYMNAVLDPVCPITPTHWMPLPHPPSALTAAPEPADPICKHCGNPTMHVGDVCYGCCQAPAIPRPHDDLLGYEKAAPAPADELATLPPRPSPEVALSTGEPRLQRYGIQWNGQNAPISTPVQDGYWTPWHVADLLLAELRERVKVLEAALSEYYLADVAGFPSFEEGKDAQDAWADRRALARNNAAALTACLRGGSDE